MARSQSFSIKDAVLKLQLSLFEGIQNENQLFAAGSLMSRSDYEDIVTERSIANLCGYPLCHSNLSSDNTRKGRYRISLKEHKVYDLQETYKYCSSTCLINSRAFSERLPEERCSVLNPEKLEEIMRLFVNLSLESKQIVENNGDLGISRLTIQENTESNVGEVSIDEWIGPSNAIEGYVPHRDYKAKPLPTRDRKQPENGPKTKIKLMDSEKNFFGGLSTTSTTITEEEYSVSKLSSGLKEMTFDTELKEQTGKLHGKQPNELFTILETPTAPASTKKSVERKLKGSKAERTKVSASARNADSSMDAPSTSNQHKMDCNLMVEEPKRELSDLRRALIKPSLKQPGKKKLGRSVTWADDKIDDTCSGNLPEKMDKTKESSRGTDCLATADSDNKDRLRIAHAEACAMALSQAAEAITSGETRVSDAVSEAGIIILPPPSEANEEESIGSDDMPEPHSLSKKPNKHEKLQSNMFDPEDSWFDAPPEGFSLNLSSFATMWMTLFAWITSSSLAYIYGKDENFHEEFLFVDGREYPRKTFLADGRSSEIKQALAGCLTRTTPGLVSELRLSTPISTLEQGMAHMLDTMTFMDALPAFRMKQWQVIVLLFIEALSVSRIPSLTTHATNRSMFHKVLDGAQIKLEEYEVMKDHILPLGHCVPEFSSQNGAA